jgi:hypothetical protein
MKITGAIKSRLNKLNLIAGMMHLLGASIILGWAKDGADWPINASYLKLNEISNTLEPATKQVGGINLALLVAMFFLVSSAFHFAIRTTWNKQYYKDLSTGVNRFRWLEYSISASIMMVAIALLTGVYDISSLVMIFALTSIMNLMGLVMELWNRNRVEMGKSTSWLAYWIGTFAGIVPWAVVTIYMIVSSSNGGEIPNFVYWIYVSIFLFFNCFAANMYLQYKKAGKWSNYLYGEKVYIWLSLIAKTALAWQVFAGTLRP